MPLDSVGDFDKISTGPGSINKCPMGASEETAGDETLRQALYDED